MSCAFQRMPDPDNVEPFDAQLKDLRSRISDLGHEVDSYKTKTAAALGGGVFLMLLAAGAAYDLFVHKSAAWLMLGVTHETLAWMVYGLGGCAIGLVMFAIVRLRRRDTSLDVALDQLEEQYAELLGARETSWRNQGK